MALSLFDCSVSGIIYSNKSYNNQDVIIKALERVDMASVFTKIMQGELPGHFVYEDDIAIAIMTIEPIRAGHTLVIPREEINHWDDVPADIAAHLMHVSQKVAKGIKKVFPAKRVGMSIVGIEVPHTHIHLCPINAVGDLSFAHAGPATQEELAENAQKLRDAINN